MNSPASLQLDFPAWQRPAADEFVNAITHAFGLMLALTGALVMAWTVLATGDVRSIVGCAVYLASLIVVYAMSTLSHSARTPQWKAFFRQLDQGSIFLLIAATYTPFSLIYLRTGLWWALLAVMWAIAIVGFVSKVFFAHRVDAASVAPYVVLGWLPGISAPQLIHFVPMSIFWWMLTGGICYTIGTLFLIHDTRVRHFHAVWHVCVIAGSACHFCGILFAIAGTGR
jgi:hemolysin III